jgi:hypothetical protein
MKGFVPLREEAEKRGKLIKAASERHAPPDEACKLIGNFGQAEIKMMKYVESHAAKCGIPPQISEQLKNGHKNTENMQQKVCAVAQQVQQKGPAGPSLSEVLGSSQGESGRSRNSEYQHRSAVDLASWLVSLGRLGLFIRAYAACRPGEAGNERSYCMFLTNQGERSLCCPSQNWLSVST